MLLVATHFVSVNWAATTYASNNYYKVYETKVRYTYIVIETCFCGINLEVGGARYQPFNCTVF